MMRPVACTRKAYMKPPHVARCKPADGLHALWPSRREAGRPPFDALAAGAVERPGGDSDCAAGVASSA